MSQFLDRLPQLAPAIQKLIRSEVVFTAQLDSDKRTRQRVEGALARYFMAQNPASGSVFPVDVRYRHRKETEPPFVVEIECGATIIGLPKELEA